MRLSSNMACPMIEVTCVRIMLQFLLLIEFFPKNCYVVTTNNNNKSRIIVVVNFFKTNGPYIHNIRRIKLYRRPTNIKDLYVM
jgi:hypothetical protein